MSELLQYTFFQNALIASILVGILCGFIGTYIVTRRLVFIAGGIAHASLGGVGICALLSAPPLIGAAAFSLLTGFSIKHVSNRFEVREDSAIAMFWAFGMSIGILCSFLSPSFLPDLPNYIFGNILLTTNSDLIFLIILTAISSIFFFLFLPQITAIAFDCEFSRSINLPVTYFENIMMFFIALSVVAILRSMGIVLAICLLSIPQITAGLFTHRFDHMILYSTIIAIICCLLGLFTSYHLNVPSGAAIVFVSIIIYGFCHTIKSVFSCLLRRRIVSN